VACGWLVLLRAGLVREKDDDVRAFVWNRRGVVGSLERGSSEVFYWEFVCFFLQAIHIFFTGDSECLYFGLLKSVLVVFLLAEYKLIFYGQ
jgi:hypothetical protein